VLLADSGRELGGRAGWDGSIVEGRPATDWIESARANLSRSPDARVLLRTTAVGHYDRDVVALVETVPQSRITAGQPRERYWVVRAERVVLATGEIEQPLVFCNNDRPGIMLAGAAREYLRRFGVAVGQRVVVATNNDSAYAAARDLKQAGVEVVLVADSRFEVGRKLLDEMKALSITVDMGVIPVDTHGFGRLSAVDIGRLTHDGAGVIASDRYACDALAISGGWTPALHLYSHAGGKLAYSAATGRLEVSGEHPRVSVAGNAGEVARTIGARLSPIGNTRRKWVDLRHDVTVSDLELAVRENFAAMEHVKRHTTVGMALDQGKTSNLAAIEIVAKLRGVPPGPTRPHDLPPALRAGDAGRARGARAGRALRAEPAPADARLACSQWRPDGGLR
jgi:sarcosine oxidase subunit alpha